MPKFKKIDTNITAQPIIGGLVEVLGSIYFNRLNEQIKFPQDLVDLMFKVDEYLMAYPLDNDPGKVFFTIAQEEKEEGRKICNNDKKDVTNSHKACLGSGTFFKEMAIAEQPKSKRKNKKTGGYGEVGFNVRADPVELKIRNKYRKGVLLDLSPWQESNQYENIGDTTEQ